MTTEPATLVSKVIRLNSIITFNDLNPQSKYYADGCITSETTPSIPAARPNRRRRSGVRVVDTVTR